MKRVFIGVTVASIVLTTLAFTPMQQNFCYYKKNAAGTACNLIARPQSFTEIVGTNRKEAIRNEDAQGNCPATIPCTACVKAYNVVIE